MLCSDNNKAPIIIPFPDHMTAWAEVWFRWCWPLLAEKDEDGAVKNPTAFCTLEQGKPLKSARFTSLHRVSTSCPAVVGWGPRRCRCCLGQLSLGGMPAMPARQLRSPMHAGGVAH